MMISILLLWIRPTPVGAGLASPAMLLFNRSIGALLPQTGIQPIKIYDDEYYEALKSRQEEYTKNTDAYKDSTFFSAGSTIAVQGEVGVLWTHGVIVEGYSDDL